MKPKQLIAAGALVGILAVGGASIASAQDSGSTSTPDPEHEPVDPAEPIDGAELPGQPELPQHGTVTVVEHSVSNTDRRRRHLGLTGHRPPRPPPTWSRRAVPGDSVPGHRRVSGRGRPTASRRRSQPRASPPRSSHFLRVGTSATRATSIPTASSCRTVTTIAIARAVCGLITSRRPSSSTSAGRTLETRIGLPSAMARLSLDQPIGCGALTRSPSTSAKRCAIQVATPTPATSSAP